MKNLTHLLMALLVVTVLLVSAPRTAASQDMVKVAPKNCKVLLENDRVRVVRVMTKPGEKLDMHSHPAHILYFFTGGKGKYTSADGKSEEREAKAGQAIWSEPVTHSFENIGTAETRSLVIELKK